MSQHFYDQCCNNVGRAVEITCHDGTVHRGIIRNVDRDQLWLGPLDEGHNGAYDGPGVFYYGYGGGWGLAWASIAALAFLPFFFW